VMLYQSNIRLPLCPVIFIATSCETPYCQLLICVGRGDEADDIAGFHCPKSPSRVYHRSCSLFDAGWWKRRWVGRLDEIRPSASLESAAAIKMLANWIAASPIYCYGAFSCGRSWGLACKLGHASLGFAPL